jgi:hypothetical protein
MTTYIENKLVNLNSENAIKMNGDFLSSVQFSFVGLLTDDPTVRSISVSIQNAQFPYSFYNINVYNNILVASDGANPPVSVSLTRGNYNANTLIAEIENKLDAVGIKMVITISKITGLLTFTHNNSDFTFYSNGSTCFKVLGFNPALNYTSVARALNAPYPLNLLGTLKMRIASLTLSVNTIDSSVGGSLNVLASIPINAGNFGLIMFENTNNISNQLNLRVLDGFDLEILDDDGNLINFNNAYWTITMLLSIERDIPLPMPSTFNQITEQQRQMLEAQGVPPEEEQVEIPPEELTAEDEIIVEPPNLEDTVEATDLDLLLYSKGIR